MSTCIVKDLQIPLVIVDTSLRTAIIISLSVIFLPIKNIKTITETLDTQTLVSIKALFD